MLNSVPDNVWRQSWQRCKNSKLSREIPTPKLFLPSRAMRTKQSEYDTVIQAFVQSVTKVNEFVEGRYVYQLYDPEGALLVGFSNKLVPKSITQICLQPGMSMSEESIGTNSLSLAMELKKPVYLAHEQHYTYMLHQWSAYTYPLIYKNLLGYLVFSAYLQPLNNELIVIANLMSDQIIQIVQSRQFKESLGLSNQQQQILQLLSGGLTETAISLELNLSVNTVKYHKKRIFHMLDAGSTAEAVCKAVKYKLI